MNLEKFFLDPENPSQRQYEAMRAFFLEGLSADEVSERFGYTKSSVYSLAKSFRKEAKDSGNPAQSFFTKRQTGPKAKDSNGEIVKKIIKLRKQYLSISEIKSILDSQDISVSESFIYKKIKKEGFARLPKRNKPAKHEALSNVPAAELAAKSTLLSEEEGKKVFSSSNVGILCFLPYIKEYGIDKIIEESIYPYTKTMPVLNSILSFLALKLSDISRYSKDDVWCMDRGLGIFSGLNVLPKTTWFSSYSYRASREMNVSLLSNFYSLFMGKKLLGDTTNLDFVSVPYWGDDNDHLETNWSGTRHTALSSFLASISQDSNSGLITHGDACVRHSGKADEIIEFLDFYKGSNGQDLKYLVFDSKFTTYQNLGKLDENGVKFLTIRRRGKTIVRTLEDLPKTDWKTIRVEAAGGKNRSLKVIDQMVSLKGYGDNMIRQVAIKGHGKIKPALIITNDLELKPREIVRKYAQRWLVEKSISEQTNFFHLNRLSSSMVIKVDFDLTMSIIAHNLYRLFAKDLGYGFTQHTSFKLYEKFIYNDGYVKYDDNSIHVLLKKKRNNPILLEAIKKFKGCTIPWIGNRSLYFESMSNS